MPDYPITSITVVPQTILSGTGAFTRVQLLRFRAGPYGPFTRIFRAEQASTQTMRDAQDNVIQIVHALDDAITKLNNETASRVNAAGTAEPLSVHDLQISESTVISPASGDTSVLGTIRFSVGNSGPFSVNYTLDNFSVQYLFGVIEHQVVELERLHGVRI